MRILVVEDQEDLSEALVTYLAAKGHEVCLAVRATEAVKLAGSFHPDIAVLDIGLPDVDGWTLGGFLRRVPALSAIPFVALTGYAQPKDFERTRAAGFVRHITKPVDFDTLERMLCSTVATAEQQRSASRQQPLNNPDHS
jgi:CheY-like chemotaxis protein